MTHHDIIKEIDVIRAGFAGQIKAIESHRDTEVKAVQEKCQALGHIFRNGSWGDGTKCVICDKRKNEY
jgi:hypothetical protein